MGYENMAHVNKNPVPNMVDMRANAKEALIMKDMGNGHMRPYLWGSCVTLTSGDTTGLVASGTVAGVNVEDCVYTLSNGNYYILKEPADHSVRVKKISGSADSTVVIDVMVFMSTATEVDVNDYTGQRGYLRGNF